MELKEVSKKIVKAFNKLEIKECSMCGLFISGKEFNEGGGACFKCWGSGEDKKVNTQLR